MICRDSISRSPLAALYPGVAESQAGKRYGVPVIAIRQGFNGLELDAGLLALKHCDPSVLNVRFSISIFFSSVNLLQSSPTATVVQGVSTDRRQRAAIAFPSDVDVYL